MKDLNRKCKQYPTHKSESFRNISKISDDTNKLRKQT